MQKPQSCHFWNEHWPWGLYVCTCTHRNQCVHGCKCWFVGVHMRFRIFQLWPAGTALHLIFSASSRSSNPRVHLAHPIPHRWQRGERRPKFHGSRGAAHKFHPELSGTPAPPDDLDPSTPSLTVALHPIGGDPPPLYRSRAAKVYRSLAVSLRCGPLICPPPSTMLPPLQTSCLPLRS